MQRMSTHEEVEKDLQGLRMSTPYEGSFCRRSLPNREVVKTIGTSPCRG